MPYGDYSTAERIGESPVVSFIVSRKSKRHDLAGRGSLRRVADLANEVGSSSRWGVLCLRKKMPWLSCTTRSVLPQAGLVCPEAKL